MRKMARVIGFAFAAAPAIALAQPQQAVSSSDGRLAAASLQAGDFENAVKVLNADRIIDSASDPARLINLGNAYAGMGRMKEARAYYSAARVAPDMTLALADGSEASSRQIAMRAMERLSPSYAMR